SGHGATDVFLYNHAYPGGPTPVTETVTFTIRNVDSRAYATLTRIDADNANPRQTWIDQGSPLYPTQRQLNALQAAPDVHPQRLAPVHSATGKAHGPHDLTFAVSLPAEGF